MSKKRGAEPPSDHPRRTGRPASEGDAVGRECLIEVTAELLRLHPPAAVTRARIAEQAGVHPTLVNYYFKDRDSLLMAALEHMLEGAIADEPHRATGGAATAQVDDRVRAVARFSASVPAMQRLMLDNLANSTSPVVRARLAEINRLAVANYRRIIDEGQSQGELRAVEPLFLHMALVGMMDFFVAGEGVLRSVLGDGVDLAAVRAAYVDFASKMVLDGLRTRA